MTPSPTTTSRPDHLVELGNSRRLAVDVRGPDAGPVVVFLHAAPGSRLHDPDADVTTAAGVRLVTMDRAGYGCSTALPEGSVPTVAGHADDAAAALDALGLSDVAVAGWSAGGRVALALAARRPDLVRSVAIIGTPAPDDEVPWVPEQYGAMLGPLRADPSRAVPALTEVMGPVAADVAGAVGTVAAGPADHAAMAADPRLRPAIQTVLAEAFRQGAVGIATDIVADQVVPWGFDPAAVGAPATLFYGAADVVAGPAHGGWYASRIAGADLRVVADAGHLLAVTAWAHVVDALLTDT